MGFSPEVEKALQHMHQSEFEEQLEQSGTTAYITKLEDYLRTFIKRTINVGSEARDQACGQCMTKGYTQDLVKEDFECAYHLAVRLQEPEETT